TMPPHPVRQTRAHDHRAALRDRGGDSQRALQRTRGASEHPAAADHPTSVPVSLTPRRDRTRDARPRPALPTTTRPVTRPTVPAGGSEMVAQRDALGPDVDRLLVAAAALPGEGQRSARFDVVSGR